MALFQRPDAALALHAWIPAQPRAVVFYIHGTQSHVGWLFETGPALAAAGTAVFALDRRGSGESEGTRGDITGFDVWREDYLAAMAHVRERYPTSPMLLVGQSFGGAIAVELACDDRASHDALLLCSPLLAPKVNYDLWRGVADDHPVAIPTPDEWFCTRTEYLAFMKRDALRVGALTSRFHKARVDMAAHYLALPAPLANRPAALVLPRRDKIVDVTSTREAFAGLAGQTGLVVELPTDDHYLEFSTAQHTLWALQAAFATSAGFARQGTDART